LTPRPHHQAARSNTAAWPRRHCLLDACNEARRFRPDEMMLADDTTGPGHITRFLTDATVLFVPAASIPA
jgi:hypothetical protein